MAVHLSRAKQACGGEGHRNTNIEQSSLRVRPVAQSGHIRQNKRPLQKLDPFQDRFEAPRSGPSTERHEDIDKR